MKNEFFFILLIFVSFNFISSFNKCGFDKIKTNPIFIDIPKNQSKRRTDDSFTTIKMKVDYSSFTKTASMTDATFTKIKQIIDETILEFQKFLKVKHSNLNLGSVAEKKIKESCKVTALDSNWRRFLIDYDIVIFPILDNNELGNQALAGATHCLIENNLKRPIAGFVYINPNLSFTLTNTESYIKQILLHEITHILVFNPFLFQLLNLVKTVDSISYIISPKVVEKARQHFNCKSLTGVPLENQGAKGSVGSHWEARYMLGDYMISTDYIDNVISDITFAIFEDSGLYQVEYYSGGLFKFGKNKGCKFFTEKCIVNGGTSFRDEFCTNYNNAICSNTRINKGFCAVFSHGASIPSQYQYFPNRNEGGFVVADYCPVSYESSSRDTDYYPNNCKLGTSSSSNYGEKMGDNSFCFMSSLLPSSSSSTASIKAICYEIECDKTNKRIIVHIGTSTVNCPTSGGTISSVTGFKGSIECPKYINICDSESNIICNDMFDCLTKKSKTDEDSYTYPDDVVDDNEDNNSNGSSSGNEPGSGGNTIIRRSSSINLKYNLYYIISFLIFLI